MHRMASISASMLNDEGGREKNAMYHLWGGSQGIQEGEECVNGGGGGGGKQKRIQREGQDNFVYVSTRYRWACNMQMHIHKHIHTCTHTHIHTCTHTHIHTYIHILIVNAGSCEFSAGSEEVGLSFQIQAV